MRFGVHGLDLEDDEEARELANWLYTVLRDAGYDVDGVAPVLNDADDDSHRFDECPECDGELVYMTCQTLTCRNCGEDYNHEKRSDRDLLWSLTGDLELDEVVARSGAADVQEVGQ